LGNGSIGCCMSCFVHHETRDQHETALFERRWTARRCRYYCVATSLGKDYAARSDGIISQSGLSPLSETSQWQQMTAK
jgi:hypothetical protein